MARGCQNMHQKQMDMQELVPSGTKRVMYCFMMFHGDADGNPDSFGVTLVAD